MVIKCLIVDDEPIAREGILEHVGQIDFLFPVGCCKNTLEATKVLEKQSVDLIFLDIQMPKKSGIEFLKELSNPPLIIFTTAFPEYAIESFELDITDYLLKPISFTRFYKAVNKVRKYLTFFKNTVVQDVNDFFFIKCNKKLEKIDFSSVLFIEGMSNYIIIHTSQKKYVTYLTFKKMEEHLPSHLFIRIHKSYIVQINAIKTIDQNELYIEKVCLPISKTYKEEVMNRIGWNLFKR